MLNNFITYTRVSTDKQGSSGLGLEAQEAAIASYLQSQNSPTVVKQFTEVESGTKKGIRPQLKEALTLAKKHNATLLIAKLDRLARNVAFIANLMESNVNFIALDNPHATKFTLHILAAVAEHEADMISKRTKEALKAAKNRGVKLGNPQNLTPKYRHLGRENAAIQRKNDAKSFADAVFPTIYRLKSAKMTLSAIANELNVTKQPTSSGRIGVWDARKVKNVLQWVEGA